MGLVEREVELLVGDERVSIDVLGDENDRRGELPAELLMAAAV